MTTVARPAGRFVAFDGFRGILSIIVILSHFPGYTVLHHTQFAETGSTLIDLFFVFSGFVIVAAFEKPLAEGYGTGRFLIERLGRIYPIHFVMLAVFVLTELAMAPFLATYGAIGRQAFTEGNSVLAILTNLTLLQSVGLHSSLTWNYPAWSLSTEWIAYLFFAFSMTLGGRRFLPFAIGGILVSIGVLVFIAPEHIQSTFDFGVFRSIYGFGVGAIAYHAYSFARERNWFTNLSLATWTVIEVLALTMMVTIQLTLGPSSWAFAITASHAVLMFVFAYERGLVSRVMQNPKLVYLGVISLSTYIIHLWFLLRLANVATVVEKLTGIDLIRVDASSGTPHSVLSVGPWTNTIIAAIVIAAVLIVAHFSYKYIESPGQKLFRGWARKYAARRAVAEGAPA